MTRTIAKIEDCQAGENTWCNIPGFTTMDGRETKLGVFVCKGREHGSTILVAGGTHGNEVMGVEICRRLIKEASPDQLVGTLLVLPILNPTAFAQRIRLNPIDGKDPSQLYPGQENGSATERLVHNIWSKIASKADVVIDLHSGGIGSKNVPHVYAPSKKPVKCSYSSLEIADAFGGEVLIDTREGVDYHFRFDRTLAYYSNFSGAAAIAPELGEGGTVDRYYVEYGLRGVRNVLKKIGFSRGDIEPQGKKRVVTRTIAIRSPSEGILWRNYELGEEVYAGQTLAVVYDVHGSESENITTPENGIILWTTLFGSINAGEEFVWIGCN